MAYDFNGTTDYLLFSKSFTTNTCTLFARFNLDARVSYAPLLESRSDGAQGILFSGASGQNQALTYMWEATADEYDTFNGLAWNLNQDYAAVLAVTPTAATLYLGDGTGIVSSWTNTKTHNSHSPSVWRIGIDIEAGNFRINGRISDLAIWPTRALTLAEATLLCKFYSPLVVRRGLGFYLPAIRDWRDLIGGVPESGGPGAQVYPHPRIIYPKRQQIISAAPTAAAAVTFYLLDSLASSSNHYSLQEGGAPPTTATTGTGWTVGTTASLNYARMSAGVERAAGTFGSTQQPNGGPDNTLGDCWRSDLLNITIPGGQWHVDIPVIAVSSGGDIAGSMFVRLWRSANADGSSATEITAGSQVTNNASNLTTSTPQILTKVFTLGDVTLTNEYLFMQIAWAILTAGGAADRDVLIRVGQEAWIQSPGGGVVTRTVSDTIDVTSSESFALGILETVLLSDTLDVTSSEVLDVAVGGLLAKSFSDTLDTTITESFLNLLRSDIADGLDASITETLDVIVVGGTVTKSVSDTLNLAISEVLVIGGLNVTSVRAILDIGPISIQDVAGDYFVQDVSGTSIQDAW